MLQSPNASNPLLLSLIFRYLPLRQVLRLVLVCRSWRDAVHRYWALELPHLNPSLCSRRSRWLRRMFTIENIFSRSSLPFLQQRNKTSPPTHSQFDIAKHTLRDAVKCGGGTIAISATLLVLTIGDSSLKSAFVHQPLATRAGSSIHGKSGTTSSHVTAPMYNATGMRSFGASACIVHAASSCHESIPLQRSGSRCMHGRLTDIKCGTTMMAGTMRSSMTSSSAVP